MSVNQLLIYLIYLKQKIKIIECPVSEIVSDILVLQYSLGNKGLV